MSTRITKVKKVIFNIIIWILGLIILYFLDVILFSPSWSFSTFRGECPIWQVMISWHSHEKYGNINVKCWLPLRCSIWETLTSNCGPLIDKDGYSYWACYLTCYWENRPLMVHKPIIYLYPEQQEQINVTLKVEGKIIADYPKYDENISWWNITAFPDWKVIQNWKEYSYLFWEAEFDNNDWDLSRWFIVEWKDSREFLEEKLSYMWLTPKEYNEFIVYWYPQMMNNKYNLIYFAGEDYDTRAPLEITPKPDSILRVFMVIKPLDQKLEIEEQKLEKFNRKWFSVIEWWGTILN